MMIEYSLALIAGYVIAKWATPIFPSLKSKRFHLHHWMWGTGVLLTMLALEVTDELLIGAFTGVVLEGLSYKNWRLRRES